MTGAIVTGAGSGIGAAIAECLAAGGVRVLAVDRAAEGLASYTGRPAFETLVADVTARDAPDVVFAAAAERLGGADILVNNAGLGNAKPLHETDDAMLDRYLDVNLRSVMRLSRAFVSSPAGGARAIVNVSSVFGEVGFPGVAAYAAAKAGIIGLTRQMVADYGPRGIRINAVAPGLIATPATAERMAKNARFQRLTSARSRRGARAGRRRWPRSSPSSPHPPRPTSPARSSPSTAAGRPAATRRRRSDAATWPRRRLIALW